MVKRTEIEGFRKRWNLSDDDSAALEKLKNRLLTTLEEYISRLASDDGFKKAFRKYSGHENDHTNYYRHYWETSFYKLLSRARNSAELVEVLQFLLWTAQDRREPVLPYLISAIREALSASPEAHFHLGGTEAAPVIYPGGDPILDAVAVDDVLQGLSECPEADKAFREALRIYLVKDAPKYRNLLDNLRFALEQLIQKILGNGRTLENNKEDFLRWLKKSGVHSYIAQMYHTLIFAGFANYQNEAVKHGEKYSPSEIEFAIYATGLFMRLILQQAAAASIRPKKPPQEP